MSDARNIALTAEATTAAERVVERLRLGQTLDAVRLGFAYAIRYELPLDRDSWGSTGGTNYNVATVDTADGTLRQLLPIFYDDAEAVRTPYRAIETLMNKGVLLLHQHLEDGTVARLEDVVTVLPGEDTDAPADPAGESTEQAD